MLNPVLPHRRSCAAAILLLATLLPSAHAGEWGNHWELDALLVIFPFLALPFAATIYLLFWRAPWLYRIWSLLVLLLSMMVVVAVSASKVFDPPWYVAPIAWIGPLGIWLLFTRWLKRV